MSVAYAVAALAFATAIALLLGAVMATWARRLGWMTPVRPAPARADKAVPMLGGVVIAAGLAPWLIIAIGHDAKWAALAFGMLLLLLAGAVRDRLPLIVSPRLLFAVQIFAAFVLWLAGFRIGVGIAGCTYSVVVALIVLQAWSTVDVLDGFTASVAAASTPFFIATGVAHGDVAVIVIAAGLAGSCVGYLRHNWPPARIYTGSAGDFAIGIVFAALVLDAIDRTGVPSSAVLPMVIPVGLSLLESGTRFLGIREALPLLLIARGWPAARINIVACSIAFGASAYAWYAA